MITPRNPLHFLSQIIIPALLMVGSQLICYPLLILIYGHTGQTEIIILILVFSSLVLGESRAIPSRINNILGIILGLCFIIGGIFFSDIILIVIKNKILRAFTTSLFIMFFGVAGQFLLNGVYFRNKFNKNYIAINLTGFISVILWICLLPHTGFSFSLILLGLSSCAVALSSRFEPVSAPAKSLDINKKSLKSIAFGIISAGYLGCYFRTIKIGLYPSGNEFQIYLILSFLFLTIATWLYRNLTALKNISSELLVTTGTLISTLLYIFLFTGPGKDQFFITTITPIIGIYATPRYWIYPFLFCSLLFIPYLFYALIIPSREHEDQGINHLFFCSLGNIIGFLIFGLVLRDTDIQLRLILLNVGCVLSLMLKYSLQIKRTAVLSILIITICFWLPRNLDQWIAAQGQWWHYTTHLKSTKQIKRSINDIKSLTRKSGAVGYLYKNPAGTVKVGIGAYSASINDSLDVLKGLAARDFMSADTRRILILGLGNQIVLQQIYAKIKMLDGEFRIDVVDNFPPYFTEKFNEALKEELGFDNSKPAIRLHYGDAFQFLLHSDNRQYDLVVWNLTEPYFAASGKLFSSEAGTLISNALKSNGKFIGNAYANELLTCPLISEFKFHSLYPSSNRYPHGLIIASNSQIEIGTKKNLSIETACGDKKKSISLNNHLKIRKSISFTKYQKRIDPDTRIDPQLLESSEAAKLLSAKINTKPFAISKVYSIRIDTSGSQKLTARYQSIIKNYLNLPRENIPQLTRFNQQPRANRKTIQIAVDLTGAKANSGIHTLNAVKLFTQIHEAQAYQVQVLDSRGSEELNADLTYELYAKYSPGSLIFGPMGTNASQIFLDKYAKKLSIREKPIYCQPTASPALNEKIPAISTFMPSRDYLKNILKIIKNVQGAPQRVHIIRVKEVPYFQDTADQIKKSVNNLQLTMGAEILLSAQTNREEINNLLENNHVTAKDWLILLDYGPGAYFGKHMNSLFMQTTKIFTYGMLRHYKTLNPAQKSVFRNSWQAILWYHGLEPASHDLTGSCQFADNYRKAYGYDADFHAAFTYASLEIAQHFSNNKWISTIPVKTIVGDITWNEKGVRANSQPLYLHTNQSGQQKIYSADQEYHWCPDQNQSQLITLVNWNKLD